LKDAILTIIGVGPWLALIIVWLWPDSLRRERRWDEITPPPLHDQMHSHISAKLEKIDRAARY